LHGLPVADDLDGRVLTELCTDEFLRDRPILRTTAGSEHRPPSTDDLDASEARQIEDRLRSMGYIE
jgi:hypothetical protein